MTANDLRTHRPLRQTSRGHSRHVGRRASALVTIALLLLALVLTGCSGSGSDQSHSESADSGGGAQAPSAQRDTTSSRNQDTLDAQMIHTGRVELRTEDGATVLEKVRKVVDDQDGTISNERSYTNAKGELTSARLTIRVPSESFDPALKDLRAAAKDGSVEKSSEDVTTQVIDVDARVRAQERSVRRIEALLDRATDLGQIMKIERELASRQGNLDSLKQQQRYLKDQVSHSTIEVAITDTHTSLEQAEDVNPGFVGGLKGGWASLVTSLGWLLTILGALLPWLVALAIVAVPVVLLIRPRIRRARARRQEQLAALRQRTGPRPQGPQGPQGPPQSS